MNDIVYLLKPGPNEELRFSLRSIEKNFPHGRIVFVGGKPEDITPDRFIKVEQNLPTKWENTRKNLLTACQTEDITENFWLFNDDFFIMGPHKGHGLEFDGELLDHVIEIEARHHQQKSNYTIRLRHLWTTLKQAGIKHPKNYAIHRPMLVNKTKALEVLTKYPQEPMFRALYGNLTATEADSTPAKDCKVTTWLKPAYELSDIISTDDKCFAKGAVGRYIRERFTEPSRWES